MAFNGAGVFNRLYSWVQDAINGIKIRADRMDNEDNGFATGLTDCVTRDGQSPATNNLPMGAFNHTDVANATQRDQYAAMGQLQDGAPFFAIDSGVADALQVTFNPPLTSYVDGMELRVRALFANATTTPTLQAEALGAKVITKLGGVTLAIGDIHGPLHELILRYNLANTRWELLNPVTEIAIGSSTFITQLADGSCTLHVMNKVTGIAPSSTVDVLRFLGPTGAQLGSFFVSGVVDYNVIDQANGANNTSGEVWVSGCGNGAVNFNVVPYQNSSANPTQTVRGAALVGVSPIGVVNDAPLAGTAKLQLTTTASGKTVTCIISFRGLIK